ncbi:MAG: 2OG-Fe(II) oxygenase [Planctomycetes bacterium]|nr:2OG-Fe(II) oxygenase [Planctomycetota bacterium]
MYLNTPECGGATTFPDIAVDVAPHAGNALFFAYDRPHPDTRTRHVGAPVLAGEKWIATRWLRGRQFVCSPLIALRARLNGLATPRAAAPRDGTSAPAGQALRWPVTADRKSRAGHRTRAGTGDHRDRGPDASPRWPPPIHPGTSRRSVRGSSHNRGAVPGDAACLRWHPVWRSLPPPPAPPPPWPVRRSS